MLGQLNSYPSVQSSDEMEMPENYADRLLELEAIYEDECSIESLKALN